MTYSLPLTSQVCSLELSKRLDTLFKAKGVKVESYFKEMLSPPANLSSQALNMFLVSPSQSLKN